MRGSGTITPIKDFNAWRDTKAADDRWYPAGASVGAGPLVANISSTSGHIRCYPFEVPLALTIKALGFQNNADDTPFTAHMGIYSAKTDGSWFPDQRLAQKPALILTAGWREFVLTASLAVSAGTLLWIAWERGFTGGMMGTTAAMFRPINGYSEADITGAAQGSIGYEADHVWDDAGLPAAFPASTFLYADGINQAPLVFVGGW